MKVDDVRRLYDAAYAASYEAKFLESVVTATDARHELELLRSFLAPGARWLDVACGTGYFLRQLPEAKRVGLDASPAMLERARTGNPDIEFLQHDFRVPIPDWSDGFDLVSCMWYAYGFVDSVAELIQLIRNLASWTAPAGRCFVPLADPNAITRCNIPYHIDAPLFAGNVSITGILWSFVDEDGSKVHAHLLSPKTEFMIEQFGLLFERVEIVEYPVVAPGIAQRTALVAGGKRPSTPDGSGA